jgi:hypothetical protein
MSIQKLDDAAWIANPCTWKNYRGSAIVKGHYIAYGLPPPPHGRREDDQDMAGGDRIGFRQVVITPEMVGQTVAIILNIEEKTINDTLKPNQKKWHNFIIDEGGISEIWKEKKDGTIKIISERIK